MGIFGIFLKEDREFVIFKTGIPGGPDKDLLVCIWSSLFLSLNIIFQIIIISK